MASERDIQDALNAAGDPAGAFLWRRVCRDLDGDLRIGVVARDEAVAGRLMRRIARDRTQLVPLRVEGDPGAEVSPTLGAVDRLLGVHAILWATPADQALGAGERAGVAAMVAAGAPGRRAVVISDLAVLSRMSDTPKAEADAVAERARGLVGGTWEVLAEDDVPAWLDGVADDRASLARDQRRAVAALLLREARRQAESAVAAARAEVARADALLATEDSALDSARAQGRRVAAHILGAMRRETESLLIDLRAFLLTLETDLPEQAAAIDELDVLRRTLPHWLHHTVETWMLERLAGWRASVIADLAEVRLDRADLDRAELLVPALHTTPARTDAGWGQRLGVTAAVGGGAALLAFGMWLPGLLAVTGGLAWSALGREAASASTRRALIDAAVDTVRRMGVEAEGLLRDQIETLEDELDQLGEERADAVASARAHDRERIAAQRSARATHAESLQAALDELDRRTAALQGEATA